MRSTAGFRHEALFHSSEDMLFDRASEFIRDGISAGEPTLVVFEADKVAKLQTELGGVADEVLFLDAATIGNNPARLIPTWRRFVIDHHGPDGRALRGISGPIGTGLSPQELVEHRHHEGLVNIAFADAPGFWLLCCYDRSALDPLVIEQSLEMHPFVCEDDTRRSSRAYNGVDPAALFSEPLSDSPPWAGRLTFGSLAMVRRYVSDFVAGAGLDAIDEADIVLAVDEMAANSLEHGGGSGTLRMWQSGDRVICQLEDRGHITDPLVGRRQPVGRRRRRGRGLWIVNQICDLLQIRTSTEGTTMRAHLSA